jgi:hypothetical protein
VTDDHSPFTASDDHSDDGNAGFSETSPTPYADCHTFDTDTVERDPFERNAFERDAFQQTFETVAQHDAVSTTPEVEPSEHERFSTPVAQEFLPVPQSHTLPIYPNGSDATLLPPRDVSASSIQDADASAVATATIKRSDLLQAELSTHPTTITDRILADLHAHGDNPVDRGLAELLSKQINGEYHHGPSHSDDFSHEHPDSASIDDAQHDHVRLSDDSDNSDKELP